jgi:hypothetical protein
MVASGRRCCNSERTASVDVDEQEAPGMTDVLVRCNRAGFLTFGSQAGFDGTGDDGIRWQQLAAVDGLVGPDYLARLREACAGTGIVVDASGDGQVVSFQRGRAFTTFGAHPEPGRDDHDQPWHVARCPLPTLVKAWLPRRSRSS